MQKIMVEKKTVAEVLIDSIIFLLGGSIGGIAQGVYYHFKDGKVGILFLVGTGFIGGTVGVIFGNILQYFISDQNLLFGITTASGIFGMYGLVYVFNLFLQKYSRQEGFDYERFDLPKQPIKRHKRKSNGIDSSSNSH